MQDTGIPEKKILRLLHNPFHLLGMKQSCTGVLGGSSTRKYQSVGMEAQAQAGCTEYNCTEHHSAILCGFAGTVVRDLRRRNPRRLVIRFAEAARNQTSSVQSVDMRIAKTFDFSGRVRLHAYFEFFNLFNRDNPAVVQGYSGM